MSVDRCPSCAAAVPAGAPWCTLCWAPLRKPEPEPEPQPAPELAPQPAAAVVVPAQPSDSDVLTATATSTATATTTATANLATQPVGWPCVNCNISIPIEHDDCPDCGRRFLDEPLGENAGLVDRLPVYMDKKGFNAAVIVAGSFGLTVLLVAFLALLGLFF